MAFAVLLQMESLAHSLKNPMSSSALQATQKESTGRGERHGAALPARQCCTCKCRSGSREQALCFVPKARMNLKAFYGRRMGEGCGEQPCSRSVKKALECGEKKKKEQNENHSS